MGISQKFKKVQNLKRMKSKKFEIKKEGNQKNQEI